MWIGGWMQTRIRDLMRVIWNEPDESAERDDSWIHWLRSAGPYKAFFYVLKYWNTADHLRGGDLRDPGLCGLLPDQPGVVYMVRCDRRVCMSAAPAVPVTAKSR